MAVMSMINDIKDGNWAGLGLDVGSLAASFIPGVGTAAAMGIQAAAQGTKTALSGGSVGDVAKSVGTSAAGGIIGNVGGSLLGKLTSKVTSKLQGQPTGMASKVTNTSTNSVNNAASNVGSSAGKGYAGTLPDLGGAAPALRPKATVNAGQTAPTAITSGSASLLKNLSVKGIKAPDKVNMADSNPNNAWANKTFTHNLPTNKMAPVGKTVSKIDLPRAAATVKSKAGQAAGQFGVQGVLAIAAGVAGAKQAKAANEVSKQGLLFQQKTYNEQKDLEEKNKIKLKEDAKQAYDAANLFGSTLYGDSSSANNIFSGGATGDFSLLNSGVTSRKTTDIV